MSTKEHNLIYGPCHKKIQGKHHDFIKENSLFFHTNNQMNTCIITLNSIPGEMTKEESIKIVPFRLECLLEYIKNDMRIVYALSVIESHNDNNIENIGSNYINYVNKTTNYTEQSNNVKLIFRERDEKLNVNITRDEEILCNRIKLFTSDINNYKIFSDIPKNIIILAYTKLLEISKYQTESNLIGYLHVHIFIGHVYNHSISDYLSLQNTYNNYNITRGKIDVAGLSKQNNNLRDIDNPISGLWYIFKTYNDIWMSNLLERSQFELYNFRNNIGITDFYDKFSNSGRIKIKIIGVNTEKKDLKIDICTKIYEPTNTKLFSIYKFGDGNPIDISFPRTTKPTVSINQKHSLLDVICRILNEQEKNKWLFNVDRTTDNISIYKLDKNSTCKAGTWIKDLSFGEGTEELVSTISNITREPEDLKLLTNQYTSYVKIYKLQLNKHTINNDFHTLKLDYNAIEFKDACLIFTRKVSDGIIWIPKEQNIIPCFKIYPNITKDEYMNIVNNKYDKKAIKKPYLFRKILLSMGCMEYGVLNYSGVTLCKELYKIITRQKSKNTVINGDIYDSGAHYIYLFIEDIYGHKHKKYNEKITNNITHINVDNILIASMFANNLKYTDYLDGNQLPKNIRSDIEHTTTCLSFVQNNCDISKESRQIQDSLSRHSGLNIQNPKNEYERETREDFIDKNRKSKLLPITANKSPDNTLLDITGTYELEKMSELEINRKIQEESHEFLAFISGIYFGTYDNSKKESETNKNNSRYLSLDQLGIVKKILKEIREEDDFNFK